jgi:predicted enzyme involved in methoxymalonyl-ACP biosynthesis
VLDLVNTLWGGVIGDDGPKALSSERGAGSTPDKPSSSHKVELFWPSVPKSTPELPKRVFQEHPESRSNIAAFVANWDDKTENLKVIASRLNIGIGNLVFVDDNPVERTRIRLSLPMAELLGSAAKH